MTSRPTCTRYCSIDSLVVRHWQREETHLDRSTSWSIDIFSKSYSAAGLCAVNWAVDCTLEL